MNIAARAGRWSAAHWKTATFGWLALVVCAVVIGNMVGTVKLTNSEQSTGESARAQSDAHAGRLPRSRRRERARPEPDADGRATRAFRAEIERGRRRGSGRCSRSTASARR